MICVFILLLFVFKCESSHKLIFYDEFNESLSLNQNNWKIYHYNKNCMKYVLDHF